MTVRERITGKLPGVGIGIAMDCMRKNLNLQFSGKKFVGTVRPEELELRVSSEEEEEEWEKNIAKLV